MHAPRIALAVALAAGLLAVTGCGGDDESQGTDTTPTTPTTDAGTTLEASVGPGFEIALSTQDGQAVTSVAPGTYAFEVNDQSSSHNFHLTGPGVDETSEVAETGSSTWTVTLEAGTYEFVCDPHAGSMNGSFEVTG